KSLQRAKGWGQSSVKQGGPREITEVFLASWGRGSRWGCCLSHLERSHHATSTLHLFHRRRARTELWRSHGGAGPAAWWTAPPGASPCARPTVWSPAARLAWRPSSRSASAPPPRLPPAPTAAAPLLA